MADRIPGFPPDIQFFTLEKFQGLNTKASRQSIGDQEFSWLENWMPIGDGNLRTLYDKGSNIYTASGALTIVYYIFYNIGSTQYCAVFLSDGTAVNVNVNTHATTTISGTPGTFYNGGSLPAAQQYGSSGIVIVSQAQTNGYWAWDGTLYSPGQTAPSWLSGLSTPITLTGTTHGTTTIDSISPNTTGVVVGMGITDSDGDIPSLTYVASIVSSSSITITQAATGSHTSDSLTINWFMPAGVQGNAIEIYQGRVWVFNGNKRLLSAPGNGADFSTTDGGGTAVSTDSFLKQTYTQARQISGFLNTYGDSSINSISNVNTSGSPATTTLNNLNVDPQTGTPWPATVQPYGEGQIFANTSGVYVLFGGAARKISDQLDGLFARSSLPLSGTGIPSGAVATLFGIRCYLLLIPGAVDYLGVSRPLVCLWDGKKWFIGSQSVSLTYIASQEVQSQLNAWGCDGTHIFQLMNTSSATLNKIMQGKLWSGDSYLLQKQCLRAYLQIDDNVGSGVNTNFETDTESTSVSVSFSTSNIITFINASGGAIQFRNTGGGDINFTVPADDILPQNNDISGQLLGITLTTQAQDATLITASLGYRTVRGLY